MAEDLDLNPNEEQKRKQTNLIVFGGIIVVLLVIGSFFFLDDGTTSSQAEASKASETIELTPPGTFEEGDAWRNTASQELSDTNQRLANIEGSLQSKDAEISALNDQLKVMDQRVKDAEAEAKALSRQPQPIVAQPTNTNMPSTTSSATGALPPNRQGLYGDKILSDPMSGGVDPATGQYIPIPSNRDENGKPKSALIDLTSSDAQGGGNTVAISQSASTGQTTVIPEGSFVRVVMITGVDAPTGGQAQDDPLPVLFETVGKFDMPNKYKVDVKGCRFLGYAWGSLATERVKARIESGNCIVNGKVVKVDVQGHVVGEDGKTGVRGKVVSKQGQALSAAALASALEAIGGLYANTTGTTTMGAFGVQRTVSSEDVRNSAIGGGISGAAEKLSEFYLRRAEELFPIVEVHAGRTVEILVTRGATVKGLNLGGTVNSKSKKILMDD
ncbi:conjugal transfer protein TraB (plasmid) [Acinetobacter indicus]|uniref:TrbI/VirB10 family protein n=1 Tax=Acinetobacter indicus TaxID=756892 RepID=UPI001FA7B850|nr:TrbI/VirB10 family protein [Acinetobacter indicus]UNW11127.1 conjugal transfer protein TraB [Acinetobacter indicus]